MNGSEKDHELKMADQLRLLAKQISVGLLALTDSVLASVYLVGYKFAVGN